MAIDSPDKRRSVSGIGFWPLIPGVTPDGTPHWEWRQQSAWSYAGIQAYIPGNTGNARRFVRRSHTHIKARKAAS